MTDRFFIPVLCTGCPSGYYQPVSKTGDDTWECFRPGGWPGRRAGCGSVIRRDQLDAGTTGDTFATHDGLLSRGLPADTIFTYEAARQPAERFTAAELKNYLFDYDALSTWDITHTLGQAAADGRYVHVSGYGMQRVITRLP